MIIDVLPTLAASIVEKLRRSGARIVIVGAGGWLGMATLELLHSALGGQQFDARVVCFGARARSLTLRGGKTIVQHALGDLARLAPAPSLLLHLAFLTKDKADDMDEVTYRATNRALSQSVLDSLTLIGVDAVFVASSGAAFSAGDVSADSALRLYGALKYDDEAAFSAWACASHKAAIIARIFNVSGPYISTDKPYALLDFIRCALKQQPIIVCAPRQVYRGYVAIRELMSVVFGLLLSTSSGVVQFDSGGEPIELFELARLVGEITAVQVERALITELTPNRYVGDATAYDALLSKFDIAPVSLRDQVRETYDYLAGIG